jgi:hypothetical protein
MLFQTVLSGGHTLACIMHELLLMPVSRVAVQVRVVQQVLSTLTCRTGRLFEG